MGTGMDGIDPSKKLTTPQVNDQPITTPVTGKHEGASATRKVTPHPGGQIVGGQDHRPNELRPIDAWKVSIIDANNYITREVSQWNTSQSADKKVLRQKLIDIETKVSTLHQNYNRHSQELQKQEQLSIDQAISITFELAGIQDCLNKIRTLSASLDKFTTRKANAHSEAHQQLSQIKEHFVSIQAFLEEEKVVTASEDSFVTQTPPPKPQGVQVDQAKLKQELETFNIKSLAIAHRRVKQGSPSVVRYQLSGVLRETVERVKTLEPLLEICTALHARYHFHHQGADPEPAAAKALASIKRLKDINSRMKDFQGPEISREEMLTMIKDMDSIYPHLDQIDRNAPQLLSFPLPAKAEPEDHLAQLLIRHAYQNAGEPLSHKKLGRELQPLAHMLVSLKPGQPCPDLYKTAKEAAGFALKSPEAFETLSRQVQSAGERHALTRFYCEHLATEEVKATQQLSEKCRPYQQDLKFVGLEDLQAAMKERPSLLDKAERQSLRRGEARDKLKDYCKDCLQSHGEALLKSRGVWQKITSNQTSRNQCLAELNRETEGFATIGWDEQKKQMTVVLEPLNETEMDQQIQRIASQQSELAAALSKDLTSHGWTRPEEGPWLAPERTHPNQQELADRTLANFKKVQQGATQLKKHKSLIDRYFGLVDQQPPLAEKVQTAFAALTETLKKRKAPGTRKARRELAQLEAIKPGDNPCLSLTFQQLTEKRDGIFKLMKKGKIKPKHATSVMSALHEQMAVAGQWNTTGSYSYKKVEQPPSFDKLQQAMSSLTEKTRARRALGLYSKEWKRGYREAAAMVSALSTATASPKLLKGQYERVSEHLEKLSKRHDSLKTLNIELKAYLEKVEATWKLPGTTQLLQEAGVR